MAREYLRRQPEPELRALVKELWTSDERLSGRRSLAEREYSLPTGEMHLVFRLCGQPVRLFRDPADCAGFTAGLAVVGGARSNYYVKDISEPACTIGAVLKPGASFALFGASAAELACRHTPLDELWGRAADSALSHLLDTPDPAHRLKILEALLAARLPRMRALHPAVVMSLERFQEPVAIREVVEESGYSHRRFVGLFRENVGLTPKLYCRVMRFQRALRRMRTEPGLRPADLALDCGYSDQAHFHREFTEFAGVTPGEYRTIAPEFPVHLPIAGRRSD